MKTLLSSLVLFLCSICSLHAETFSSSTNFVQTLRIGTNEAIFISTLKAEPESQLTVNMSRSNEVKILPLNYPSLYSSAFPDHSMAFAGPMNLQFQKANVLMEFQRVQTSNVFTAIYDTNGTAFSVPDGRTVHFLRPYLWYYAGGYSAIHEGYCTLSNNVVVIRARLYENDNFTGPLAITLTAYYPPYPVYTDGWITYYFTDEFASLPSVGATVVPAGKSIISIEKSQDLLHWRNVFLAPVGSDQSGFYRLNFSK